MRGYSTYNICKKCLYKGDWHTCPGMGPILHPQNFKEERKRINKKEEKNRLET